MDQSLRTILMRSGAVIDGSSGLALHFGDPAAELRAALDCCALVDRSDLGRLLATGPDLLALLNRLSTGKLDELNDGEGVSTVVTTAKGRIVELLFVHRLGPAGVLIVCGAGASGRVLEHLTRFTFAEQTGVEDVTAGTGQHAVIGPRSAEVLEAAGFPTPEPKCSVNFRFDGIDAYILGEDGLATEGYSIFLPAASSGSMWHALNLATSRCGGRPVGSVAAEAWRVLRGLPASGNELTEDYNPLEAGLYDAVSFDKGCYVGQEVVARLNTYDKVSRSLVGLVLPAGPDLPTAGAPLYFDQREAGVLTSVIIPPGWSHPVGIAYLKRKVAEPGIELAIGSADATTRGRLVRLPFSITPSS
jgi:folate-binding protein YgfZ